MAFKIHIMQPATFTTVKMLVGEVLVLMVLPSEPGDLARSSQRAFVQVNGHPGKVGCVYRGLIWSQRPVPPLAVAPPWGAEVPHLRSSVDPESDVIVWHTGHQKDSD